MFGCEVRQPRLVHASSSDPVLVLEVETLLELLELYQCLIDRPHHHGHTEAVQVRWEMVMSPE